MYQFIHKEEGIMPFFVSYYNFKENSVKEMSVIMLCLFLS